MKKNKKLIGLILILIGLLVIEYPISKTVISNIKVNKFATTWETYTNNLSSEQKEKYKEEAKTYNTTLPEEQAKSYADPFEQSNLASKSPFSGVDEDQAIGIIRIPKLSLTMPIYMDSTEKHLKMGAAVVTGTSLPIGGNSTRSVIAAHRGFYDFEHFLHIDLLEPGDRIYIDILGNNLIYEAYEQEVIMPYQGDKLNIIKDQDTLTLLTCHPYPISNKRLLVNAKRVEEKKAITNSKEFVGDTKGDTKTYSRVKLQKTGFLIISIICLLLILLDIFAIVKHLIKRRSL